MKKKCVAIIVLLGCCLFVTAYTKGEAKNAQADYMVSETDDGSETFETDHGFYTDADDVERAENEPQNEQTDYILHEIDGASEEAETDHGFHNMTCYLPSYEITENHGYSSQELNYFLDIIKSTAHLIMEFAKEGGFENASGF